MSKSKINASKIAIIILNYNGCQNTIDCVNSVRNSKQGQDLNIVVVDNASTDGSTSKLSKIKGLIFLQNKDNLGYSGGNNVGIKWALEHKFDQILILNNDTIVSQDMIRILSNALNKFSIVTPKIYFAKGFEYHKEKYREKDLGNIIWYAGGKIDWENVLGVHIGVDEVDSGQYNNEREIDFATGACLMVKKEVFEKIGLFDEKYFLYLEDMDFCVRAKKAGFMISYQPKASLWHKNAASAGGSGSNLQDYYITRNRLLFAFKYANLRTKLAVIRQVALQIDSKVKRKALLDFLTYNFGKSNTNFNQ